MFVLVILVTRYVSLGSLLGSAALFPAMLVIWAVASGAVPPQYLVYAVIGPALIWVAHADNIDRLIHGTERKFDLGMLSGRGAEGRESTERGPERPSARAGYRARVRALAGCAQREETVKCSPSPSVSRDRQPRPRHGLASAHERLARSSAANAGRADDSARSRGLGKRP